MEGTGFALLNAAVAAAGKRDGTAVLPEPPAAAAAPQRISEPEPARPEGAVAACDRERVDQACREPMGRLVEELALCRRYYEATFPNQPVERLVFVGGEAHQRALCAGIAREMGIAAQVGDPLARMVRQSEVGIESGIDRRTQQPAWAIAVGLSLGPATPEKST
jgi:Tfp pilus assembly PilM family ATPase